MLSVDICQISGANLLRKALSHVGLIGYAKHARLLLKALQPPVAYGLAIGPGAAGSDGGQSESFGAAVAARCGENLVSHDVMLYGHASLRQWGVRRRNDLGFSMTAARRYCEHILGNVTISRKSSFFSPNSTAASSTADGGASEADTNPLVACIRGALGAAAKCKFSIE